MDFFFSSQQLLVMLKNRLVTLCLKRTNYCQPGSPVRQIFIEYVTYHGYKPKPVFLLKDYCTHLVYNDAFVNFRPILGVSAGTH